MENPFAEQLEALGRPNYGRLSFEEQCAFYAAHLLGVPPAAIAATAGVSQSVVSLLKGAGTERGGQIRYPKVAREYTQLGHDAFVHKYLNPLIRERLHEAIAAMKKAERNPDINEHGFSPRATRYLGRSEWAETSIGLHSIFRIELHPTRGGYFWRDLKPFQGLPEVPYDEVNYNPACQINGDPSRGPERGADAKGFPTSEACYRYLKDRFDPV